MPADLDALIALVPFAGHLGLVLDEADAGRVIVRLDWAPHLCTTGYDAGERLVAQAIGVQAVR